jgi:hypothetical protein
MIALDRDGAVVRDALLWNDLRSAGQERTRAEGRNITDTDTAVANADVTILAVPDRILGAVSADIAPKVPSGSIILTLDPAAAYAGLLAERDDIYSAAAHPCHPSVFYERTTKEQWADTFGGIAAPQEVVAALETGTEEQKTVAETVIRAMYAPWSTCTG